MVIRQSERVNGAAAPGRHSPESAGRSVSASPRSISWVYATSSQRPNLNPTCRSVPARSNPTASCNARLFACSVQVAPTIVWCPRMRARAMRSSSTALPTPPRCRSCRTYTDASTVRAYAQREFHGDSAPQPITSPPRSATTTGCAADRPVNHASRSSAASGSTRNVQVELRT